ncbi:MAG: hypothetical protein C4297_12280 [Gemmataceae bacterium]
MQYGPTAHRSDTYTRYLLDYRRVVPVAWALAIVAALTGWVVWRHWQQPSEADLAALLDQARTALAQRRFQEAILAVQQAHDRLPTLPRKSGKRWAGAVYALQGEIAFRQALCQEPDRRAELLKQAEELLGQALQMGLPDEERPHVEYVLARCEFEQGKDIHRTVARMENALDASPRDRVEGYEFLCQVFLRLPEPRLDFALRVNGKLLAEPDLPEGDAVRLRHGELLMRLGRWAEAREALARIGAGSPQASRARHLEALAYYREDNWPRAAAIWETTTSDPAQADRPEALYYLGVCAVRMGQYADAAQIWERLRQEYPDHIIARAASLRLADLYVYWQQDRLAYAHLEAALTGLAPGAALDGYASASEMDTLIEKTWSAWIVRGQFDLAHRLLARTEGRTDKDEYLKRWAWTWQAQGLAYLAQAMEEGGNADSPTMQRAQQAFAEAAAAFEKLAELKNNQPDYRDCLWAAGENHLRARQYERARVVLERYLAFEVPPAQRHVALVGLGEAYRALGEPRRAEHALRQALECGASMQARAHYLLALTYLDQGRWADAEAALRQILAAPLDGPQPPETRQALFALGLLLHRRQKYEDAVVHLRRALDQYPRDPQALKARYVLADCCRLLGLQQADQMRKADTLMARDYYGRTRKELLEQALTHYQRVVFDLSDRQATGALAPEDQEVLRESRFGIAECLVHAGQYEAAAHAYRSIVETYPRQAETLTALVQLTRCYWQMERRDQALATIERAQQLLEQLDDAAFRPPQLSKKQWQEWLNWAATQIRGNP